MSEPRTYELGHRGEVVETDPAGHRKVILAVPEYVAVDVLEALRRAYQDGREDLAAEQVEEAESARRNAGRRWTPVEVKRPLPRHPQQTPPTGGE
jgi:hypothetical protein